MKFNQPQFLTELNNKGVNMKSVVREEICEGWLVWQPYRFKNKIKKFVNIGISYVEDFLSFMLLAKVVKQLGPGENEWEVVERKNSVIGF